MPPATSVSSVKVTFSLTPASSSAIFFAPARRMKWYPDAVYFGQQRQSLHHQGQQSANAVSFPAHGPVCLRQHGADTQEGVEEGHAAHGTAL